MATPETYVLHGDDGRVYRIHRHELDAFEVSADDPEVRDAVAEAKKAKDTARAAGALFACLIAARAETPEDRSVSGGSGE
jgi:hypothetical protein